MNFISSLVQLERPTFTRSPSSGDYILGHTGISWSVDRRNGNGSVMRMSEGGRRRATALEALLSLAAAERTDAWETAGAGEWRLIKRHRS
jgi:hypothetical protein